jgi:hypothetical protein
MQLGSYYDPATGDASPVLDSLNAQRDHVLDILTGLSEDQLRRPVLPSGWSCLGMVNHLALDVEHYWFRCIVAGEPLDFSEVGPEEELDAWHVGPDQSAQNIFDLYREEIARANHIITRTPLDAAPMQRDTWWGEWEVPDLRFIVLHVIAETACHAGHLDAVRELLDGRQWVVLWDRWPRPGPAWPATVPAGTLQEAMAGIWGRRPRGVSKGSRARWRARAGTAPSTTSW